MRPSAASAPEAEVRAVPEAFAIDVRDGLTAQPKRLAARWLYDDLGSALFEAICRLPWYRITSSELQLLRRAAPALARRFGDANALVELGPGSGEKLSEIVGAFDAQGRVPAVHLVDVSAHALELAARTLSRFPGVDVHPHEATFQRGIAAARRLEGRRLIAFLGSNIGNFDPREARALMNGVAEAVGEGDGFLLGADLVKPVAELLRAYDDPIGVTAAFNRNLLSRINHELDGEFDLSTFRHEARWNERASRIEMHLVSTRAQDVTVGDIDLRVSFAAGESIWTESSYKYDTETLADLGREADLRVLDQWLDAEAHFALTLFGR
jgi:L-histidine N-alpha-methyltransferase